MKPARNLLVFVLAAPLGLLYAGDPAWLQDAAPLGIPVGAKAPGFALPDQSGHERNLMSLMGKEGLVLVFFRSADW